MSAKWNDRFRNRSEIAEHLGVSRMTLSRWEKKTPLPKTGRGCHVMRIEKSVVDDWYKKLIKEHWWLTLYRGQRLSSGNVT